MYTTDSNKYRVTCSQKSFETPPEHGSAESVEYRGRVILHSNPALQGFFYVYTDFKSPYTLLRV